MALFKKKDPSLVLPSDNMAIPRDYVGSSVEVMTLKNDLISTGHIEQITWESVEISDAPNNLPELAFNTPLKIGVFNANLGFRMLAGQVYLSTKQVLRITDVVNFVDFERRRYFRLDVNLSATIVAPPGPKDIAQANQAGRSVPRTVQLEARVRSLSLCGLMFEVVEQEAPRVSKKELDVPIVGAMVSDQGIVSIGGGLVADAGQYVRPAEALYPPVRIFTHNDQLEILLTLGKATAETLTIVVKRVQELPRGNRYGCEIIDVNDRVSRDLCAYLFQLQREQIQRNRQNRPE